MVLLNDEAQFKNLFNMRELSFTLYRKEIGGLDQQLVP